MNFLSALGAGCIFALACNLDTLLAAVAHGAQGGRPGLRETLTVTVITTAVTFLSLSLGALGAALLPAGLSERLGGAALAVLGLWYLLDGLRGRGELPSTEGKSWAALSAALAVNNAGVGVAAGVTGLPIPAATGCNFWMTLLSLALGCRLGERLRRWSGLALPVSGVLLMALGLWQLL